MHINKNEIEKIAHLARLSLAPDEAGKYAQELSQILDLVAQMELCNTEDVRPMAHPMDAVQRLRPDRVTEENQRDTFQTNAPAVSDGHYLVPRVLE